MPKGRSKRSALKASITNRPTGGGNKKEGLAPSVGKGRMSIWGGMSRSYGTPESRDTLSYVNQIGSVGSRVYQTSGSSGGGARKLPKQDNRPKNLKESTDRTGSKLQPDRRNNNSASVELNAGLAQTGRRLSNQEVEELVINLENTEESVTAINFSDQPITSNQLIAILDKERRKSSDKRVKTLILRGCTSITKNGWDYLIMTLGETSIVNLDISKTKISFDNVIKLIRLAVPDSTHASVPSVPIKSLNLNNLDPKLSQPNIIVILNSLKGTTIEVIGLETPLYANEIAFMKSNHILPQTKKLINPNAKPLLPGILELIMDKSGNDTIMVDATIQGSDKAKTGVKFNWFVKKQVYKKGMQWVKINGDNVNENSNKLQYKLPNQTTGSRGVKENSELKCEVTPFLKESNGVKEGKPETIEFIGNNWSIAKRSFILTSSGGDEDLDDSEDTGGNSDSGGSPSGGSPSGGSPSGGSGSASDGSGSASLELLNEIYNLLDSETKIRVMYLDASGLGELFVNTLLQKISTSGKVNVRALYLNNKTFTKNIGERVIGPILGKTFPNAKERNLYQEVKGGGVEDIIDQRPYDSQDIIDSPIIGYMPIVRLSSKLSDSGYLTYNSNSDGTGRIGTLNVDSKHQILISYLSININRSGHIANIPYDAN